MLGARKESDVQARAGLFQRRFYDSASGGGCSIFASPNNTDHDCFLQYLCYHRWMIWGNCLRREFVIHRLHCRVAESSSKGFGQL